MPIRSDHRKVLAASPFFGSLSSSEIDALAEICRSDEVKQGAAIFHKGEMPDRICAIVSGGAHVTTGSTKGREIQIRALSAGDVFGEIAVLDGEPRTAAVIATEPTELIVIERQRFRGFLASHPDVSLKLLDVMASRLRDTTSLVEDTIFLDTASRIAKLLLKLAAEGGVQDDDGLRLTDFLTQRQIANRTGCVRESVNKQLRRWVKAGVLSFDDSEIVLFDLDLLDKLVNGDE